MSLIENREATLWNVPGVRALDWSRRDHGEVCSLCTAASSSVIEILLADEKTYFQLCVRCAAFVHDLAVRSYAILDGKSKPVEESRKQEAP